MDEGDEAEIRDPATGGGDRSADRSAETWEDQIERLRSLAAHRRGPTWLSDDDRRAIEAALERAEAARVARRDVARLRAERDRWEGASGAILGTIDPKTPEVLEREGRKVALALHEAEQRVKHADEERRDAIAAERERCAAICDEYAARWEARVSQAGIDLDLRDRRIARVDTAEDLAAAIRAAAPGDGLAPRLCEE
jgi:hypothetical protein